MTQSSPIPIVVSQGDPCGVGPELILKLAACGAVGAQDTVVGDPQVFEQRAATIAADWAKQGWLHLRDQIRGHVGIDQVQALALATDLVLERPRTALVTGPIDKAACAALGFAYPGHTEYLAARAGGCEFAMLMAGPKLKVVLATIHVPLGEVTQRLGQAEVVKAGRLLASGLQRYYGIANPRIGVLGLNPHAGERGLLGNEERTLIAPAIASLRERLPSAKFAGPLPADTAFFAHLQGEYDGLVAMYHDQGLAPFKLIHFYDGVNVTLGLPFVRTSPDHGTARDIAGQGIANPASFLAAVELARRAVR